MGLLSWMFPRPRRPDMPAGSVAPPTISSEEFFRQLAPERPVPGAAALEEAVPSEAAPRAPVTPVSAVPMPDPDPDTIVSASAVAADVGVVAPDAVPDMMEEPAAAAVAASEEVPEARPVEAPAPVQKMVRGPVVDGVELDDALALYAVLTSHQTHLAVARDTRLVMHSNDLAGGGLAPLLAVVPKANGGICFLLVVDGEIDTFGVAGDAVCGPVVSLRVAAAGVEQLVTLRRPLATDYLSATVDAENKHGPVALVDRELSAEERFLLQPITRASLSPRTAGYLTSLRQVCGAPLTGERVLTFLESDPNAAGLAEALTRAMPESEIAWLGQRIQAVQGGQAVSPH